MTKEELREYCALAKEAEQLYDQHRGLFDSFNRLCAIGAGAESREEVKALREELKAQYLEKWQAAKTRMLAIEKAIGQLNDPEERVLLRYRYLQGLSWAKIEEQMHYSERQVHRIHGRALQHIKEE